MEKAQVSLCVPAVDKEYEVLVPVHMKVQDLIPLFIDALIEVTSQEYADSKDSLLCWLDKGVILNKTSTLSEYGIQNGDSLFLY